MRRADRLEVSERTIYRDVSDLQAQGVPLEGEAGVGYRLGKGFDLPPLMFTQQEALALVAAVRVAQTWLDPGTQRLLQQLREAAQTKRLAHIIYRDAADQPSERTVRPLGVFYWGAVWTLGAWCETREDFRSFRVDRIESLDVLTRHFADEPVKTLADMLRSVQKRRAD